MSRLISENSRRLCRKYGHISLGKQNVAQLAQDAGIPPSTATRYLIESGRRILPLEVKATARPVGSELRDLNIFLDPHWEARLGVHVCACTEAHAVSSLIVAVPFESLLPMKCVPRLAASRLRWPAGLFPAVAVKPASCPGRGIVPLPGVPFPARRFLITCSIREP